MNAIIDEGVPRDFAKALKDIGCPINLFPNVWKGTKNGRLLKLLEEAGYDCLVTCDKTMEFQQEFTGRPIGLVVLPYQRLADLVTLTEVIAQTIAVSRPGIVLHVAISQ